MKIINYKLEIVKASFAILVLLGIGYLAASSARAAVLSKAPNNLGLLGYWSLNDGTSTKAGDSSGNGNTGTLTLMDPATDWVAGKRGKALDFDGTDDYVDVPVTPSNVLNISGNQITQSAWIYPTADVANGTIATRNGVYYLQRHSDGKLAAYQYGTSPAGYHYSTGTVPLNQWSHVAYTYNGSILIFYINGVASGSVNKTGNITPLTGYENNPFRIGWDSVVGGRYFKGKIDDVRIYNRALTPSQITALYQSGSVTRKVVSNLGLVGYWSMNDGAGTKAGDSSGNGNTGTLTLMDPATDWVAGKRGKALDFDGTDDYVDAGNITAVDGVSQLTISGWVKRTSGYGALFFKNAGSATNWIEVAWHSSTGLVFIPATVDANAYMAIPAGTDWKLITCVFDGTQTGNANRAKIYVNGVLQSVSYTGTIGTVTGNPNSTIKIGRDVWNSATLNATIDDVRIYNRALSATEVSTLYRQGEATINSSQNTKLTSGLVGLWSFNGADISGTTAYDRSGQGNNGTLTNAQTTIGKVGQGMIFNNTSSLMALNSSISLASGVWSIATWFKYPLGPSGSWNTLTRGNVIDHQVIVSSVGILGTYDNTGGAFLSSGYNMTTLASKAGWHHLVAVGSGSTTSFYIDGVLVGSSAFKSTSQISYVGNYQGGTQQFGTLDEVRVYNRALTPAEVGQLYSMGK